MLRLAPPLVSALLLCACAGASASSSSTPPPSSAAANEATGDNTASGYALDREVVQSGSNSGSAYKFKLRVDEDGTVVKQAMYHRDEAAVPEAVRALAAERFGGAVATHYETELYADIGRVYEVEVDNSGTQCELAATADGTELYTECHVDPASLSSAIKATIDSVAPGGEVLEAESKQGPKLPEEYTVEVKVGDNELYLRIAADGTLLQALRRIPAVLEVPLP